MAAARTPRQDARTRTRVVESLERVELRDGPLEYRLRRSSRSRSLRVTIHPERGVVVSVPLPTQRGWADPKPHVEAFLRARDGWIRRHLDELAARRSALQERPALGKGRSVVVGGVPHLVRVRTTTSLRRSRVIETTGATGPELWIERAAADRRPVERVLDGWLRIRAREAIDEAIERHADALRVSPAAVTLRDPRSRWGSCSRAGRLSFSWRLILAPPEALECVVVHELCHLRVFGHGPTFRQLLASRIPDHVRWRRWLREHAHELHAALDASGEQDAA